MPQQAHVRAEHFNLAADRHNTRPSTPGWRVGDAHAPDDALRSAMLYDD
jgi:hypothetical protein